MTRRLVWLGAWTASLLVAGCIVRPGPATLAWPVTPPTAVASPTLAPEPPADLSKFLVVYDNYGYDPALRTGWGFSCWVEAGETTVLFDTGADGATLLANLAKLGLDPQEIDAVVLSHIHSDHVGGLADLLGTGVRPTVYVPAAFPESFQADVRARTDLVPVTEPIEVSPGIYTTGQMGSGVVEQALVVQTGTGLVIVTGCAHPGIAEMVRQAKEVATGEVALVMGGFHLGGANESQIAGIIAEFRETGVQRVAPSHCTGDQARQMFAAAYGADCALPGVGWAIRVGADGEIGDGELIDELSGRAHIRVPAYDMVIFQRGIRHPALTAY